MFDGTEGWLFLADCVKDPLDWKLQDEAENSLEESTSKRYVPPSLRRKMASGEGHGSEVTGLSSLDINSETATVKISLKTTSQVDLEGLEVCVRREPSSHSC